MGYKGLVDMKRWFWVNGRFGWPLIIALLFVTVSAVVFDFVHRVVVVPFTALVLYAVVGNVLATALMIVGYLLIRWRISRTRHV
jgi:amino acid transporter